MKGSATPNTPPGISLRVQLANPLGPSAPLPTACQRRPSPTAQTCRSSASVVGFRTLVFHVEEPLPGQWYVEVSTAPDHHLRHTVGGFVTSPIRLAIRVEPRRPVRAKSFQVVVQVLDGDAAISAFRADARVTTLPGGLAGLRAKHEQRLKSAGLTRMVEGDAPAPDTAPLLALRDAMLTEGKADPFAHSVTPLSLRHAAPSELMSLAFGGSPAAPIVGQWNAAHAGSYNLVVTAGGMSPISDTRFLRQDLVSVVAG